MFDFGDGTNLLSEISAGSITTIAALVAKLQLLAGAANVTWTGETNPRISLTLTKVIDGEGVLEFEFDESGGRAEIRGEAKIKVTVTLRLVFGVDETTGEFYGDRRLRAGDPAHRHRARRNVRPARRARHPRDRDHERHPPG